MNVEEQGAQILGHMGITDKRKSNKYFDKILTERVKALSFSTGETAQATCKIQEPC